MPKTGDFVAEKYRIEQLIGVGGMGAVFSATHQYTGKRVALKWLLPELATDADAVQRFMREARAAGRISHPNVVDVYDVGRHEASYFLVMEYLQGEPLTSALARRDLTFTEVLTLLLPAMRGVAAAHREGVVHRDLKPDNIFISYEEDAVRREAKVLDFGISKLSADDQPSLHLTRTGAVVGTPYYMSPEQIRSSQQLDRRADIYAFGVILYEALTGQVPFQADTYGALVLEIATGTPKPPKELVPSLPAEVSRIVLRAMARDMEDRYPTMEDLIAALEPFARPSSGTAAITTGATGRSTGWTSVDGPGSANLDMTCDAPTPKELARQPTPPRPALPSKPPLQASTPFASEVTGGPSLNNSLVLGVAGFMAAAAALVGGIWYLTREPGLAAPAAVTSTVSRSAATALPPAMPSIPSSGASIGSAPGLPSGAALPGAKEPAAALEISGAQPAALTVLPELSDVDVRSVRSPSDPEPSGAPDAADSAKAERTRRGTRHKSAAARPSARSDRAGLNRRHGRQGAEPGPAAGDTRSVAPPPAQAKPAPSEPRVPPVVHRPRSGELNVNEF